MFTGRKALYPGNNQSPVFAGNNTLLIFLALLLFSGYCSGGVIQTREQCLTVINDPVFLEAACENHHFYNTRHQCSRSLGIASRNYHLLYVLDDAFLFQRRHLLIDYSAPLDQELDRVFEKDIMELDIQPAIILETMSVLVSDLRDALRSYVEENSLSGMGVELSQEYIGQSLALVQQSVAQVYDWSDHLKVPPFTRLIGQLSDTLPLIRQRYQKIPSIIGEGEEVKQAACNGFLLLVRCSYKEKQKRKLRMPAIKLVQPNAGGLIRSSFLCF